MAEYTLNYAGTEFPLTEQNVGEYVAALRQITPVSAVTMHLKQDVSGLEVALLFSAGIPIFITGPKLPL